MSMLVGRTVERLKREKERERERMRMRQQIGVAVRKLLKMLDLL